MRLEEAGAALDAVFEHSQATTISGLVLLLLGRPAAVGDTVTWNNIRVEVTTIAGRGVSEAIVQLVPAAESATTRTLY